MKKRPNNTLRWTLRVITLPIIAFSLIMFIGETMDSESVEPMKASEIMWLSLAGLGLLGLAIAWIWELIGGIISLAAFAGLAIISHEVLSTVFLWVWPIIAILFIILWATSKKPVARTE